VHAPAVIRDLDLHEHWRNGTVRVPLKEAEFSGPPIPCANADSESAGVVAVDHSPAGGLFAAVDFLPVGDRLGGQFGFGFGGE